MLPTHAYLRTATLVAVIPFVLSCAPGESDVPDEPAPMATNSPHLFVWAGAEDEGDSDFLAVIDADPESGRYGEIVASVPVGLKGGAHHSEHVMPAGDTLFVAGCGRLSARAGRPRRYHLLRRRSGV